MSLYPKKPEQNKMRNFYNKTRQKVRSRTRETPSKYNRQSTIGSEEDDRLVINLAHCRYPLVKKIAEEEFNMRISRNPNEENWDIFWSDVVKKIKFLITNFRIFLMVEKQGWSCSKKLTIFLECKIFTERTI